MSALFPLHRSAILAGLLALAAPSLTHAQARDAGAAKDAGSKDAGKGNSDVEEEDGVVYIGRDKGDGTEEDGDGVSAAGGGVSCALGQGAGVSGALLLLGVLAARRARRRDRPV